MAPELLHDPQVTGDAALRALADYSGPAEVFWPLLLQALAAATGARRGLLLSSRVGQPWQARAQWPSAAQQQPDDAQRSLNLLGRINGQAMVFDDHVRDLAFQPGFDSGDAGQVLAVLLLDVSEGVDTGVLESVVDSASTLTQRFVQSTTAGLGASQSQTQTHRSQKNSPAQAQTTGVSAVVPAIDAGSVSPSGEAGNAHAKAERLHEILQLAQSLSQHTRFIPAAMALCNQLCSRFEAERVSLGWRQQASLRLTAISHVEHFDAKSNVVRALEEVMEESLEQEALLTHPPAADTHAVLRAHESYARMAAPSGSALKLCSIPLDGADGVVGVICLERLDRSFDAAELWEIEQTGRAVCAWLAHLQEQDRWLVLRGWDALQRGAREWMGPRHTAWKLSALSLATFLVVGAVWPWSYRIDATLAVRSRDLQFMPAPFDGYLRHVHVDVGDQVASGSVLAELDTRDLLLEESMAEADLVRYTREAEKAMATRQLAEMQIALARQQQAQAKLELTRFQLANAQVRAPYDGVVIEGELKKNLGAPVRKGDLLLKLARTTRTYLELEIDQAYVHEVKAGTRGEFALVGRPSERYPITLTQLDPAAVNKEGRTVYLARAALVGQQQPDWRPGMGGNAKLEAGDRPLIWVLTHRTVRFLREFFWL